MSGEPKILFLNLWERTSAKGTTYLSGYFGKARVVGFRGDPTPDGVLTWNLFLTPGREQTEQAAARKTQDSGQPVERRRTERPVAAPAGDPRPVPFDDSVEDVGR